MLTGTHSVTINRPIAVVFDHIADGRRNATWRGPIRDVKLISGDGAAGSVWLQLTSGAGGRVGDSEYRVIASERPRRYALEIIDGPVAGTAEYALEETSEAATVVGVTLRLRPRGLMASLSGIVNRQMALELSSLDRLRAHLEGG